MDPEFVNLTPENLADEHLSCIIRVRKPHPGVEAKRQWLADRLREGHVFRKLQVKDPVFIEYAPLETAWVPVLGDNYLYVYCLWAYGAGKGKGYGRALMEYCLADARVQGKSGVCLLGAKKQKAWLTDQAFARKFGFEVVDATDDGYELLALSFDGTVPRFAPHAKAQAIDSDELTIYYDFQCPYVPERIEAIRRYCEANDVPLTLIQVDSLQKAKELPGGSSQNCRLLSTGFPLISVCRYNCNPSHNHVHQCHGLPDNLPYRSSEASGRWQIYHYFHKEIL